MSETIDEPGGEGAEADRVITSVDPGPGTQDSLISKRRWITVLCLALVTLVLDQATKAWALGSLNIGEPTAVVGPLQFNLAFNTGMAFSRGANSGPIIGVLAILITGAMIFFARTSVSRFQWITMGAIIGGALGNIVDRLLRVGALGSPPDGGFMSGAVVDFIDVQFWPIFNIADAAVVVGGLALAISMFFVPEEQDPELLVAKPVDSGVDDS